MAAISPLPYARLAPACDPEKLPWKNSRDIPWRRLVKNGAVAFHPRAMRALDLALKIGGSGHHVFLCGEPSMGRGYFLESYLRPIAERAPTPPDLLYVHNFENPDEPRLLSFPAGKGAVFRDELRRLVEEIGKNLEKRLESAVFARQRARLIERFHDRREELLEKMHSEARGAGFNLELDENDGVTLTPAGGKKRLSALESKRGGETRFLLKNKSDRVAKNLAEYARQIDGAVETLREKELELARDGMALTLNELFTGFEKKFLALSADPELKIYLGELRENILRDTEAFLPSPAERDKRDERRPPEPEDDLFYRYDVNVFVDNGSQKGAPLVIEDNPTYANLLGCVEREAEMGALVTDFTLIKGGSLHKANGGYLALRVEDLFAHPQSWEGLVRALRSNLARIEDTPEFPDLSGRVRSVRPKPAPLNVKVILIGDEYAYESLLENDERFVKLFGVKAGMAYLTERNRENIRYYLASLARVVEEANLPPFDASALAWLVDYSSRLAEDQRKLSLKFPKLRELMIEAAALARAENAVEVNAGLIERAGDERVYRENLVEEEIMEDYARELIKTPTTGVATGRVNGLTITWNGDYEFGLPQRISCAVGVGQEGVIDLEREAELGGAIHTKAMMILKSYLTNQFARKRPLVFSASLYFEQSYGDVEGDSASCAELAALLSALAETPLRQDLAVTGAVNNVGALLPVGGVTGKIEGFYKVCAARGLTGSQGVIIPRDNVDSLTLSRSVLESVKKGEFFVYPARTVEDVLFLLTGINVGKRRKDDTFTPKSLFDKVDRRLETLGYAAQNAFGKRHKERSSV